MLIWIPVGFLAILAYSFWLSARVAVRRQSAFFGFLVGLIALPLLWGIYLVALAHWARRELREFLETYLPLIMERALEVLEQLKVIGANLQ